MSDKPFPSIWPSVYATMLPRIREIAREHGYAIAVHGSMLNDYDLVAVPWVEDAADAEVLAEAIRAAMDGWEAHGCPGIKPHGRLVWSFAMAPRHYIDLSVMPKLRPQDSNLQPPPSKGDALPVELGRNPDQAAQTA